MSQRLRRKAAVSPSSPGPLLRASAKFLGLAKLALAKRLRQQPGQRRGSATPVPQPSPGEASRYMGVVMSFSFGHPNDDRLGNGISKETEARAQVLTGREAGYLARFGDAESL